MLTQPDLAVNRLRDDYRRLNGSLEDPFGFRFGRGGGFCAEMLGLVKCIASCLHGRRRLCLTRGGRPAGIAVAHGFTDYFEPLLPEIDAGILNALNRQAVRGSGHVPMVRQAVSKLLGAVTGARSFMMDGPGALPQRLRVPELGIDADYADACALLTSLVWVYRRDVGDDVGARLSGWHLPASYLSVHVRRGDKDREAPHVPVAVYASAIARARPDGCAVVIASDDGRAADELAALLPPRYPITFCSAPGDRGYRRDDFNRLPAIERFERVKRFLAELEALRRGDLFLGSSGSNVTYLIDMMRGGHGVLQVQ